MIPHREKASVSPTAPEKTTGSTPFISRDMRSPPRPAESIRRTSTAPHISPHQTAVKAAAARAPRRRPAGGRGPGRGHATFTPASSRLLDDRLQRQRRRHVEPPDAVEVQAHRVRRRDGARAPSTRCPRGSGTAPNQSTPSGRTCSTPSSHPALGSIRSSRHRCTATDSPTPDQHAALDPRREGERRRRRCPRRSGSPGGSWRHSRAPAASWMSGRDRGDDDRRQHGRRAGRRAGRRTATGRARTTPGDRPAPGGARAGRRLSALRENEPPTGMPPQSPAATLAAPWETNSRSASHASRSWPAKLRAIEAGSAKPTTAMIAAGIEQRRARRPTAGRARAAARRRRSRRPAAVVAGQGAPRRGADHRDRARRGRAGAAGARRAWSRPRAR